MPKRQTESDRNIDLGLAILSVLRTPGSEFTHEEIAAWCECGDSKISSIQSAALQKIRSPLTKFSRSQNTNPPKHYADRNR